MGQNQSMDEEGMPKQPQVISQQTSIPGNYPIDQSPNSVMDDSTPKVRTRYQSAQKGISPTYCLGRGQS
jgi:hypothetical protein